MNIEANKSTQEVVGNDWEHALEAIKELGISNDPSERLGQLSDITGEGIMGLTTNLHRVVASENSHEPTDYTMHVSSPDGTNRRPLLDPEQRSSLFDEAATLVRSIVAMGTPGTSESQLGRTSNVLALAVVLAHPFEDGNGRTARTMAQLVREGYDESDQAKKDIQMLGGNRPASGFRIYSFLPTHEGKDATPSEILVAAASLDIPLAETEKYATRKQRTFTSPFTD